MSMPRMSLNLYVLLPVVISLVDGQSGSRNTKVGSPDTKFFLPTSGSSPDLLSGAAGFGLGLAASQIGGNLINSLGSGGGSGSCCCGRRKRQAEGNPSERFFGLGGGNNCGCGRKKRQVSGKDTKLFGLGGNNNCGNCGNCGGNFIGGSSSSGGYNSGSRCQCTSQTFYSNGKVQGNCRSRDETGRVWCYTTGWNSGCGDLHSSSRYPNNPWSYNACSNNYG